MRSVLSGICADLLIWPGISDFTSGTGPMNILSTLKPPLRPMAVDDGSLIDCLSFASYPTASASGRRVNNSAIRSMPGAVSNQSHKGASLIS